MTLENKKKFKAAMKKKISKHNKQILKRIADDCKKQFCNKTCKNTMFEAGKNTYPPLPPSLTKDKKLKKLILDLQKKTKKDYLATKKMCLKMDFMKNLVQ